MQKLLAIQKCDGPTDVPTYRTTRQGVESRFCHLKSNWIGFQNCTNLQILNLLRNMICSMTAMTTTMAFSPRLSLCSTSLRPFVQESTARWMHAASSAQIPSKQRQQQYGHPMPRNARLLSPFRYVSYQYNNILFCTLRHSFGRQGK